MILCYGLSIGIGAERPSASPAEAAFGREDFVQCVTEAQRVGAVPRSPAGAGVLLASGTALLAMGLVEHAVDHLARACSAAREAGDARTEAYALANLCAASCQVRSLHLARRLLGLARVKAADTDCPALVEYLHLREAALGPLAITSSAGIWIDVGAATLAAQGAENRLCGHSLAADLAQSANLFFAGDIDHGFAGLSRTFALAQDSPSPMLRAACRAYLGYALTQIGEDGAGLGHLDAAREASRRGRHYFNLTRIDHWVSQVHARRRDARSAYLAARCAASCEQGFGVGRAIHGLIKHTTAAEADTTSAEAVETSSAKAQPDPVFIPPAPPRFSFAKLIAALDEFAEARAAQQVLAP